MDELKAATTRGYDDHHGHSGGSNSDSNIRANSSHDAEWRDAHDHDTLVLSGGGPDGLAFIGCVRWLEEHTWRQGRPPSPRNLVGCSAGAIVALFLAMGLSSSDVEDWVRRGIASGDLTDLSIEGILDLARTLGVDDGERVMCTIRAVMRERGIADDATFMDLAKLTGRNLVVCVTNLSMQRRELLSVDTAPSTSVLLAVRMSMGLPLIFTPVVLDGCTYVDGSMYEYCPTAHIEVSGSATRTLVLQVSCAPSGPAPKDAILPDAWTYMSMLSRAMLQRSPPSTGVCSSATHLRRVSIDSLMMGASSEKRTCTPPLRFDIASMSIVFDPGAVDLYIAHGYAAMEASRLTVPPVFCDKGATTT